MPVVGTAALWLSLVVVSDYTRGTIVKFFLGGMKDERE